MLGQPKKGSLVPTLLRSNIFTVTLATTAAQKEERPQVNIKRSLKKVQKRLTVHQQDAERGGH